ncbi:TP53-binding protein 1 isoform X2 [Aplysia californica]|nr:TP53-binding protein 1 isoform X2 [Aplysia californica]
MSNENPAKGFAGLFSATESEGHQPLHLASDTVSSDNGSSSKDENDRNVTVIERVAATSNDDEEADRVPVSTPAEHIGSLHLSAEPMLVPETMDSFDEVGPSPDAYGSAPLIIPDSPSMEGKGENEDDEEEDNVVSFKPTVPTLEDEFLPVRHSYQQSQAKSESQSFHLRLTPSQPDQAASVREDDSASQFSPRKNVAGLEGTGPSTSKETSSALPSFHLQKPSIPMEEVETNEDSERSISVFQRVKSGLSTPQKKTRISDDSEDFPAVRSPRGRIHTAEKPLLPEERGSTPGKREKLAHGSGASSSYRSSKVSKSLLSESFMKSPSKSKTGHVDVGESNNNLGEAALMAGSRSSSALRKDILSFKLKGDQSSPHRFDQPLVMDSEQPEVIVCEEDTEQGFDLGEQTVSYEFDKKEPAHPAKGVEPADQFTEESERINIVCSSSEDPINPSQKRAPVSKVRGLSLDEEESSAVKIFEQETLVDPESRPISRKVGENKNKNISAVSDGRSIDEKGDSQDQKRLHGEPSSGHTEASTEKSAEKTPSKLMLTSKSNLGSQGRSRDVDLTEQTAKRTLRNDDSIREPSSSLQNPSGSRSRLHEGAGGDEPRSSPPAAGLAEPSVSRSNIFSESNTLRESASLDPYIFRGSQSQNFGDISALPLSDRPRTGQPEKKKSIKTVRKVLKKKMPSKEEMAKSSSTDEGTGKEQRPARPVTKSKKTGSSVQEDGQPDEPRKSEKTQLTTAEDKRQFSKPQTPPPVRASPSARSDVHLSETLQLDRSDSRDGASESVKARKSAVVSFSDERPGEAAPLVRDASDNSDYEVERTVKRSVLKMVVTVIEETRTEILNSKRKVIRHTESSRTVFHQEMEPVVTSEEVKEHTISPVVSPSRSVSTVTTGDLADISSSSLSRTYSSGSKTSNPSLDMVPLSQGLPTPAQRERSASEQPEESAPREKKMESPELPAAEEGGATVKDGVKRLSSGSNTGQDLFSTPNQSIIDRADSQLGKTVSSSHSTPGSHPHFSPTTHRIIEGLPSEVSEEVNTSVAANVVAQFVRQPEMVVTASSPAAPKIGKPGETPGQGFGPRASSRGLLQSDSEGEEDAGKKTPSKAGRKRKQKDTDTESAAKRKGVGKSGMLKRKEDPGESTDNQSTGFSVHTVPPSVASGESSHTSGCPPAISLAKPGVGVSSVTQSEAKQFGDASKHLVLTSYKSKVEPGAQIMGKWQDGFYYPGVLARLEPSGKKFLVKFDDGSQKSVKPHEIILAQDLPVGQSVMVLRSDGFYECGMIMQHSEASGVEQGVLYHVERDDGVTQRCKRSSLILTEDQAAILLSDEELRVTPDAVAHNMGKVGDISLDNLVEGKRHPRAKKSNTAVEAQSSTSGVQAVPATSTALAPSAAELTRSGRKRKLGPVATSTPTPKQAAKEGKEKGTPVKRPIPSPLGGVMASPSDSRRSPRKARLGLFESSLPQKSKLFEGMVFMLTHIDKSVEQRAQEKRLLQDSSLDTSADDNTDTEPDMPPFVKDRVKSVIELGGGIVIKSYDEKVLQSARKSYLVAAEHQRTIKYLQALAAEMTVISHQWVLESAAQNSLQALTAYILPAGISVEKKKLIERSKGCSQLIGLTPMVVSTNEEFVEAWTSILTIARCHVVTRFPARANRNDPGVDVVVSDATCPASVVRRCRQLDVPLVSSEWVAQCLINGNMVDFAGHERYKYDFIE